MPPAGHREEVEMARRRDPPSSEQRPMIDTPAPAVWISHLGHALPGRAISQEEAVSWLEPRLQAGSDHAKFHRFAGSSGVSFRHSVLDIHGAEGERFFPTGGGPGADMNARSATFDRAALPLALAAVHAACPAGLGEITHIIVATCTGAVAPGLDIQLATALKLRADVRRTMIAFMGCYAAIPALRTAWYTCRADPRARVLVVCCELGTLHLRPGPADEELIAALLFADGASAAIVEAAASPAGLGLRIVNDASVLVPDSAELMTWAAASDGFALHISPRISSTIGTDLVPLSDRLLGAGRLPSCARWAVHPGGPRIVNAVETRLALGVGALASSRAELAEGGNRSSATVMTIVERELRTPWQGPLALLAFGPGLTADALLIERW
jgi:alpha-pyrone synthase